MLVSPPEVDLIASAIRIGNDRCHCRLAQARRTIQQAMVKRLAAPPGCGNCELQIFLKPLLTDIVGKITRS